MIMALKIRRKLQQWFGGKIEESKRLEADFNRELVKDKFKDWIIVQKDTIEIRFENFKNWMRESNTSLELLVGNKFRNIVGKVSEFGKDLTAGMFDFGIETLGTMIGGFIGTFIPIPVLGPLLGAAIGGGIGSLINAWRKSARDEEESLNFLATFKENKRRERRARNQNELSELSIRQDHNEVYQKQKKARKLRERRDKLSGSQDEKDKKELL